MLTNEPSIRHVKCDETRPACKSCTSTSRTCDGYSSSSSPDTWEIITPISAPKNLGLHPQSKNLNDKANSSLHYFRSRTVQYVSGLFGFECEDVILRASVHESAIHYAILAVGSIHKDLEKHRGLDVASHIDEWATKQYNLSIRCLTVSRAGDFLQYMDVVLATCILYACFEVNFFFHIFYDRRGLWS
jgi:hypothetical protein